MKNMKKLFFGFAVLSISLFSCKKDNNAPLITGFTTTGTVEPGEVITISATFTDAEGLAKYKTAITKADGSAIVSDENTLSGSSYNYSYNFTIPTGGAGIDYIVTITVTDDGDDEALTVTESKTISVPAAPVAGGIISYTAKLFGGQSNPSAGSFFNANTGDILTTSQATAAQSSVDLVFAYGMVNANYFAAPNDAVISDSHSTITSWTTKNATKLKTTSLTAAQFTAVADDATIVTEATGAADTKVSSLAVGQVFAFETVGGKKGLVHVSAIGGTTAADRSITVNIKVQD